MASLPHHPGPAVVSRRTLLGAGALAAGLPWLASTAAAATGDRPWTIPGLREWQPGTGSFTATTDTRIVVAPAHAGALSATAAVMAADLQALRGIRPRVVLGTASRPGDILLRLGADDAQLGAEGYVLQLGARATVTANAAAGAHYGGRSLLQLLAQGPTIPAGRARDWPRYAERGLMLDIGRKHLSYDWIAARVLEMSWLKLNYLHLHFTEDLGWRIESDQSPRVHSEDAFLTKAEVRSLIALCRRHHITVVPEVDVPGHMGAALRNYPHLQIKNALGVAEATKLDFTLPAARAFARGLVEEYVDLFPGPWFHLGFDEFVPAVQYPLYPQLARYAKARYGSTATAKDGIIGFANEMVELVRGHGKTARVAHDGTFGGRTQQLDRSAVVEWWTDFSPFALGSPLPSPQEVVDAGNRIQNIGWYPTYYSNLPAYFPVPKPDLEGFYEDWRVHRFRGVLVVQGDIGTPYHEIDPASPLNTGSRLSAWFDDPDKETPAEIAAGIQPRLRIMAQQTWESPHLVPTYAEFATVIDRVGGPPGGR